MTYDISTSCFYGISKECIGRRLHLIRYDNSYIEYFR